MAKAAKKRSVRKTSAKKGPARKGSAKARSTSKGSAKRAPARKGAARKGSTKKTAAPKRAAKKRAAARPTRTTPPQTTTVQKKNAARAAASRKTSRPAAPAPSALGSAATLIRGAVAGAVAAVTQKLPWTSDEPDAIQMLEADHRRFEDLLRRGEETTERAVKGRSELLATLTRELNAHEMKEEKFLYPMLAAYPAAREIVLEGYQEHHVADVIVKELHEVAADNEQWGAKFKVLKENLEHHIQEEEGEMFRIARAEVPREELLALAQRMAKAIAE
jgi:hemerythrin-like domain-containing protein